MSNWYIDFDSTLYDTTRLTADMLETIAIHIDETRKEEILQELKSLFNRDNIYNIFELCDFFENKYSLPSKTLSNPVKMLLADGAKYLYEDSEEFLKTLQSKGHKIFMLTSASYKPNMEYQQAKILGSGLTNYFEALIITAIHKDELHLDYENGIFVDDNPSDLKRLYEANAKKVIRIKRKNNKYSDKPLNISDVEEYNLLSEITIESEED